MSTILILYPVLPVQANIKTPVNVDAPSIAPTPSIPPIAQQTLPRTNPNDDRLLPSTIPEELLKKQPQERLEIEKSPTPELDVESADPNLIIDVSKIVVEGNTIISDEDIATITQPLEGKPVRLKELQGVANEMTRRYVEAGYLTTQAVLGNQVIEAGMVTISVIEGALPTIEIEGNGRLKESYIRDRIQLGLNKPLNTTKLEENLRLLSFDPLFKEVKGSLKPGKDPGETRLAVQVKRQKPWSLNLGIDNYSVPSIAPERAGATFTYRNLTGLGDYATASYYTGLNLGDFDRAALNQYSFGYGVPLNAMNGTLQFRADINNRKITDPALAALNIEGNSELYELSYRQPVIRTLREEFALSVGFAIQEGETLISPPFLDTRDRNRVLSLGQDYLRRDPQGFWSARSQFNLGLDIFDASAGSFFSWSGQAQRVQRLGNDFLLIMQGELQLTPDTLPSFYDFVIGGGQSLRGYRQNARSGDNGYRLSIEGRILVLRNSQKEPTLQLAPFFDVGQVWNTGNDRVFENFLAGVGIGVLWEPFPRFNLRLDYGHPIIGITEGTRSLQDEAIYFSVSYSP
ncbi:ShlB/FhaC/HecB family hemolysin secretion/activation protein [Acaryochloris sp. IP29b_bin.148]|uniref:ShlB/FhaC/HecB family hemolysin secretion/activation protein n=1 Tax=Acaryochloris sp. IP29b_bin.148 TaxID=2969218 RepID=UPI002618CB63|nr:ShlB/FhaC/HecB family hemolysin secretion/activation protein [Acaryochloris sp. IP29b_bin.148]